MLFPAVDARSLANAPEVDEGSVFLFRRRGVEEGGAGPRAEKLVSVDGGTGDGFDTPFFGCEENMKTFELVVLPSLFRFVITASLEELVSVASTDSWRSSIST